MRAGQSGRVHVPVPVGFFGHVDGCAFGLLQPHASSPPCAINPLIPSVRVRTWLSPTKQILASACGARGGRSDSAGPAASSGDGGGGGGGGGGGSLHMSDLWNKLVSLLLFGCGEGVRTSRRLLASRSLATSALQLHRPAEHAALLPEPSNSTACRCSTTPSAHAPAQDGSLAFNRVQFPIQSSQGRCMSARTCSVYSPAWHNRKCARQVLDAMRLKRTTCGCGPPTRSTSHLSSGSVTSTWPARLEWHAMAPLGVIVWQIGIFFP